MGTGWDLLRLWGSYPDTRQKVGLDQEKLKTEDGRWRQKLLGHGIGSVKGHGEKRRCEKCLSTEG